MKKKIKPVKKKVGMLTALKIGRYERTIQDMESQLPRSNNKKRKIMIFVIKEIKRRIKFLQQVDKMERS